MARPKTPTNVLQMRGAFSNHPERKNEAEPEGNGEFSAAPPSYFTPEQVKVWREFVAAIPAGVLTGSDAFIVEVVALLFWEFRDTRGAMQAGRITRMCALMGRLGLDPSGRAGLVAPSGKRNKFDDV